jgi:hypothetical protein
VKRPVEKIQQNAFEIAENLATICGKSFQIRVFSTKMVTACKHPKVRIVSRQEDTEYLECLECGDVFDAEEFNDMAIEESAEKEVVEADDD